MSQRTSSSVSLNRCERKARQLMSDFGCRMWGTEINGADGLVSVCEGSCHPEAVNELEKKGVVPSLHHRKEGWLRHQENIAQPPMRSNRGGFPLVIHRKTTPASRSVDPSRRFRIARPPLLALIQGGDYASISICSRLLRELHSSSITSCRGC